jgi:hypothetical protein
MVPEIPLADVPLIERIRETHGEFAAYMARFECAKRAAGLSPEEIDFRRRMAANERALLGYSTCDRGLR